MGAAAGGLDLWVSVILFFTKQSQSGSLVAAFWLFAKQSQFGETPELILV
jgi:hypothetical protein